MSVDSYAPCPCGSGKKVKFCCQAILTEMEKVERLLENNQPRMALQALEKVVPEHGNNAWVATAQGWALIADHRPADAKAALAQFLRKNPDHPSANALHALAAFQAEGFPGSKKAVHRAFRRSFKAEPSIVAGLAASMAELYQQLGHVLASRQHYALALRYGDEEDRKQAFSAMVAIDGDETIPYPMRGVHNVPEFHGLPATQEIVQKANRLSAVGCWEEAAELIKQACEQQPDSAEGWHTLGLFLAWDGNDSEAAAALHKAARLYANFETAVECETLAQFLDPVPADDQVALLTVGYPVESVSRLLTRLDEQPRLARVPDQVLQASGLSEALAAEYDLLDGPAPKGDELGSLSLATAPTILGRVTVVNAHHGASDHAHAHAILSALQGAEADAAKAFFVEAAGDAAGAAETSDEDPQSRQTFSRERLRFRSTFYVPMTAPPALRDRIEQQWQTKLVTEIWPVTPQGALGGKSPRDAKGVDELRVPLAAAINVLDAMSDSRSRMVSVNELRQEYGLPAMELIDVPADANVNLLSLVQVRRVNLRSLSDEQFRPLLRRVLLSRHNQHAYETLREYLENRTQLHGPDSRERNEVLEALVEVCRRTLRRDEALKWVQHGQTLSRTSEKPFELLLAWKMKELLLRLQDRDDPQGKVLFDEIWNHFGMKVPQLREQLAQLAAYSGLEPPGQGVVVAGTDLASGGGITLEPASAATAGEKKLWLPGMD